MARPARARATTTSAARSSSWRAPARADIVCEWRRALWRFWDLKGHLAGRQESPRSRAAAADERPTAARAKALSARPTWRSRVEMLRRVGVWPTLRSSSTARLETRGAPRSPCSWSPTRREGRRLADAQRLYAESARGFRECGDAHYAHRATRSVGWAYHEGGDLERARAIIEENLHQARATDDEYVRGSR